MANGLLAQRRVAQLLGLPFVDPTQWFCTDGQCPVFLGNTLVPHTEAHISGNSALITTPLLYDALFAKR